MTLSVEERADRQREAKRKYGEKRKKNRGAPLRPVPKSAKITEPPPIHLVIPDSQAKPGVPNDHMQWCGQYIVDQFAGKPLTVIHLGDHYDMPSLSSYDKGKKSMEGRRYQADIKAGNRAFDLLDAPLRAEYERSGWMPRRVYLHGNHEDRITRAIESDAQLDGLLSLDHLIPGQLGWEVHGFLEPVVIDGVHYSHYWYLPNSGRPYGGMAETRLKSIGHSFTQGHQQGLQIAQRSVSNGRHRALIAGSFYQHAEEYRGPQAANEWRGVVVCHQVENGDYDLMEVSLDFLCREYEGHRIVDHVGREL